MGKFTRPQQSVTAFAVLAGVFGIFGTTSNDAVAGGFMRLERELRYDYSYYLERLAKPGATGSFAEVVLESRCPEAPADYNRADRIIRWAVGCNLLTAGEEKMCRYTFDDNGNQVPRPSDQVLFPVYTYLTDLSNPASVRVFNPDEHNWACLGPNNQQLKKYALCQARGCYSPEQQILFSDGYTQIHESLQSRKRNLVTLTLEASIDEPTYMENQTQAYTVDQTDLHQTIFAIQTASGNQIRITHQHPMLMPDGTIREASELKVGDALVRMDGSSDEIVFVEAEDYFGKVYNLRPITKDLASNILVAEGFLTGSSRYQNEDRAYLNRVVVRQNAIDPITTR